MTSTTIRINGKSAAELPTQPRSRSLCSGCDGDNSGAPCKSRTPGQTRCGTKGAAHCGQVLSCGSLSTLLYARRIRMRLVDGFLLGTPINSLVQGHSFSLSNSAQAAEDRVRLCGRSGAFFRFFLDFQPARCNLVCTAGAAERRGQYLREYEASSPRSH